ncbi:MAG: DUF1631 domain-containing protein [bacterium]
MHGNMGTILEQAQDRIADHLKKKLVHLFENTDDYLFEKARDSANNAEQDVYFAAMRDIRKAHQNIVDDAIKHHHAQFVEFSKSPEALLLKKQKSTGLDLSSNDDLSLIDENVLELSLAVTNMANKAEGQCSQQLYGLNERFSVLTGGAKVTDENNPAAPKAIADAFAKALSEVKLELNIHLMILKLFDHYCLQDIKRTYDSINEYLREKGILPNLKYSAGKNKNPASQQKAEEPVETKEPDYFAEAETEQTQQPQANSQQLGQTPQQNYSTSAPQQQNQWQQTPPSPQDLELFQTIRELLAGRRSGQTGYQQAQANAPAAPVEDVVSILSALQTESLQTPAGQAPITRGSAQIKSALTSRINDLNGGQNKVRLGPVEEDTADLMGMMFDHIFQDPDMANVFKNEMSKLQVPILKVALNDKQFFTKRQHPARELLNTISELSTRWLVEGENERTVLPPVHSAIDRILHEYDTDVSVFEELNTELNQHRDKLKKRAKKNEQRATDAVKGREKLALAHQQAEEIIDRIVDEKEIASYPKTLLKEGWSSYLALSILRHGVDNELTHDTILTAESIVQSVIPKDNDEDRKAWREKLPGLRDKIEDGLTLVGYHHDDIQKILAELSYCQGWAMSAAPQSRIPSALTSDKPLIKGQDGKDRTPEFGRSANKLRSEKEALNSATEPEQEMMTQIKSLPFGTWFDYADPDSNNKKVRVKLAWYSPISSKCLFVDKRGQTFAERSLLEAARDIINNRSNIMQQEKQPLVDRAMKAIAEVLGKAMPVAAL